MGFTEKKFAHLPARESHLKEPPYPKSKKMEKTPGDQHLDIEDKDPVWLKDKGDMSVDKMVNKINNKDTSKVASGNSPKNDKNDTKDDEVEKKDKKKWFEKWQEVCLERKK